MDLDNKIEKAAKLIEEADALMINSGAGMGVDSGMPDFRGDSGFWKAYPPIAKLGASFSQMANPSWFDSNPKLAWAFYGHRLNMYRETKPHSGFKILLELAENKPAKYFAFTSNVDGHFQKAGFAEDRVAECHGTIHYFQCKDSCTDAIWNAEDEKVIIDEEKFEAQEPLPKCRHCDGLARPNVLMFGDWSWIGSRTYQQERDLDAWLNSIRGKKLTVIECGAGTAVPTVRFKSESVARDFGGRLIRINPREAYIPGFGVSLPLGAKEALEKINEKVGGC